PPQPTEPQAYQEELQAVRTAVENSTAEQKRAVKYWTNNPAIRWNELAMELIAKYNLISGPNADGSYTLPNPANPQGPPPFPFAHPAYACRVLAYMSVAQFDGLISAWHHKYTFNRPAPYEVDGSIDFAYGQNDIRSSRSGGGASARVSKTIVTSMLPLEAEYFQDLGDGHSESLSQSGGHGATAVAAGLEIADAVSATAPARAATDGM